MSRWRTHAEHGPPGRTNAFGWVHPKTGLVYQSGATSHARQAMELGFKGQYGTEINDAALAAGYTRWHVVPKEIGVHFNKDCPLSPIRAKEILAYHAQNQRGRMLLADTGTDYYHGTSLKDAHDFIDRVSTKLRGRKETDFVKMKRELGESHDYDPSWDYDIDSKPHRDVVAHVDRLVGDHHDRGIFSHLGIGKPTVHYVKNLRKGHLARYVDGTSSDPVIVVDSKAIHRTAKRYGVELHDAVESTLLHEYGHAHFDSTGERPENEEDAVEHFAHHTWRTGDHVGAASDMRSMSKLKESRADQLIRAALEEGRKRQYFFHGTRAALRKGDMVLPWRKLSGEGKTRNLDNDPTHDVDYAYAMTRKDHAWDYADVSHQDGEPVVYRVRSNGDHEPDPSKDSRGEYFRSRTGFRVVGKVRKP